MVERHLLTANFVDAATPPDHGEQWVSDTKLRGFGLRLWRCARGEGKAFAIRTIDKTGRSIRRTYDAEARNEYFLFGGPRPTLGAVVDRAREWAEDELCRAKGKPTLLEEEQALRKRIDKRLSKLTLDNLVQARFRGMEIRGLSEKYRLTIDKLYHQHVPANVRRTKISAIRPRVLNKIYRALREKPGVVRTLRAFLGQIINDMEFHSIPLSRAFYFARQFSAVSAPTSQHSFDGAAWVPEEVFDRIFVSLDHNREEWIQARFIRLLFEFNVPADRLMRAEWNHIAENYWYPWLENERKYWWRHARLIDDTITPLLKELRDRTRQEFSDSTFLFPSRLSSTGHIRTFETAWRRTASQCKVHETDFSSLVRFYQRHVVTPRRILAYRARHYGNFVQDLNAGAE